MPIKKCIHGIRTAYCKICGGSAICNTDDCTKRAFFAKIGESAKCCRLHKKIDMVDVVNRLCKYEACITIPSYSLPDSKVPEYCTKHKSANMINIVDRHCDVSGCTVRCNFGFSGEKPNRCITHRLDGMINTTRRICEYVNCRVSASFGTISEMKLRYCAAHKETDMIQPYLKYCEYAGCLTLPTFANDTEKRARFCIKHKTDTMIDVKNPRCRTPECSIAVHRHINRGYCIRCFIHLFPDEQNACNYKTKERTVVDYITRVFPDLTIINDKRIEDGCSMRRPDILIDLGEMVICIEIDENMHYSYDCSCENKRVMEISRDLSHRPLILIRFNPDAYINESSTRIKSPWALNARGISTVKHAVEWEMRLSALKEQVQYWIENRTEKTVEIIQLFYDCNDVAGGAGV